MHLKKALLLLFCYLFCHRLLAQNVNELIAAEKSFAAAARATTTKKAFVTYLDSSSVVFREGAVVNGMHLWNSRPEDSSLLLWKPEIAVLSSSGNFGITAGPSEFRIDRTTNSETHYAHFASLWHKNSKGIWKVLCDIGIGYKEPYTTEGEGVRSLTLNATHGKNTDSAAVKKLDTLLANEFGSPGTRNITSYFAPETWLLIRGRHPLKQNDLKNFDLTELPPATFVHKGDWFSPAVDMYVGYGTATHRDRTGNFIRVWIYRDNTWKLILLAVN